MSQLSYGLQNAPFAGMKGDMMFDDVLTYANGEASLNIDFGLMVKQGTTDKSAKAMAAAADVPLGVTLHSHQYDNGPNGTLVTGGAQPGVKPNGVLNILNKGRVWVKVEQAVNVGDQAFVRYAAGAGGSILGSFRKDVDTASAVAVKAKYRTSALANAIALVEWNFEVF